MFCVVLLFVVFCFQSKIIKGEEANGLQSDNACWSLETREKC